MTRRERKTAAEFCNKLAQAMKRRAEQSATLMASAKDTKLERYAGAATAVTLNIAGALRDLGLELETGKPTDSRPWWAAFLRRREQEQEATTPAIGEGVEVGPTRLGVV